MENNKLANPAVIGLGGFGMTTMMLQFHNLGWLHALSPILCLGLVFGGTAQLIAGLMEFKKGNNFGTCAFTAYGAFWISLCFMLFFRALAAGAGADSAIHELVNFGPTDLAWFLAVWGVFTGILFIASLKHNFVLSMIFLTLTLGFFGLAAADFGCGHIYKTIAAYDLLVCAALAWYGMASVVYDESGIKLPMGKALWK